MNNYFTSCISYITTGPRYNNIIYQMWNSTYRSQIMIVFWDDK